MIRRPLSGSSNARIVVAVCAMLLLTICTAIGGAWLR